MMVHHQNVVHAAAGNGVSHIVYLSGLDADPASPFCYAYTNGYTEGIIRDSGCGFSFARASIYTEFFLRFVTPARGTGEIRLPAADGRISLVSRADVGRCLAALAVAAPTGGHHAITGPESLDLPAIAERAEHEWRTAIRYTDLAPAAFAAELAAAGEDPWWTYAYSTMFASIREQRWEPVSDDVRELTGSEPAAVRWFRRASKVA
jgi:NAD(P)H dehydrogenase (quinone)